AAPDKPLLYFCRIALVFRILSKPASDSRENHDRGRQPLLTVEDNELRFFDVQKDHKPQEVDCTSFFERGLDVIKKLTYFIFRPLYIVVPCNSISCTSPRLKPSTSRSRAAIKWYKRRSKIATPASTKKLSCGFPTEPESSTYRTCMALPCASKFTMTKKCSRVGLYPGEPREAALSTANEFYNLLQTNQARADIVPRHGKSSLL